LVCLWKGSPSILFTVWPSPLSPHPSLQIILFLYARYAFDRTDSTSSIPVCLEWSAYFSSWNNFFVYIPYRPSLKYFSCAKPHANPMKFQSPSIIIRGHR